MSLSSLSSVSAFFTDFSVTLKAVPSGKPQLQEQLGPLRKREELLLDMAERRRSRATKMPDGRQHHGDAVVDAPLDHAAQHAVDAGLVNRMRIVVVADT